MLHNIIVIVLAISYVTSHIILERDIAHIINHITYFKLEIAVFYIASSEPVVFVFDYGDNVEL